MTGWIVFTISLTVAGFVAIAIWAACAINQVDKHLDDESKKLRQKRLTLEAELELAYWNDDRENPNVRD